VLQLSRISAERLQTRKKRQDEDLLRARAPGSASRFRAFLVAKLGVLLLVTTAIGAVVRLPSANRFRLSLEQIWPAAIGSLGVSWQGAIGSPPGNSAARVLYM